MFLKNNKLKFTLVLNLMLLAGSHANAQNKIEVSPLNPQASDRTTLLYDSALRNKLGNLEIQDILQEGYKQFKKDNQKQYDAVLNMMVDAYDRKCEHITVKWKPAGLFVQKYIGKNKREMEKLLDNDLIQDFKTSKRFWFFLPLAALQYVVCVQ